MAVSVGSRTGAKKPPNSWSTIDAQRDAPLAEIQATTGETLNVKSFGAIGDGIADDTVAIEAADAAAVSGTFGIDGVTTLAQGEVYFPPGTYKHSGLTYRGARWRGAGWHATTLSYTGSGASVNAVGTNAARKILGISDMALDGTNASAGAYGLEVGYNQRSPGALRHVLISNFPSWGIYFSADSWIMSFYDVYCVFNATTANSGIGTAPSVGTLAALEWYNLILENNGKVGNEIGGGIELNDPRAIQQWAFYGGTWEGNLGAAEARFIDCESIQINGVFVEAGLAAAGAMDGLIIGGSTQAGLQGCRFTAVRSHGGTALRLTGTSVTSMDNCWFHQANWPRHIAVEDTASCALLSESNLSTSHVITVANGAAFLRSKPLVRTLTDAATIAVDASLGDIFQVTLGGNRTIGVPTNPSTGQRITFVIDQDARGSRTLTWAAPDFKTAWSDTGNGASSRCTISFRYFNSRWNQEGAQSAYY